MNAVVRLLRGMGRNATLLLPLSLALGLGLQDLAAALRVLLWPLAVTLLMLALARTNWDRVTELLRRPGLALLLSLASLTVVPSVVWVIWHSLGLWPGLVAALCLSAMAPGIFATVSTATFLRLEATLALQLVLITNFLVPFTLPPMALWLLDLDLHISAVDLSLRLASVIAAGSAGAFLIRRWPGRRIVEGAATLDGLSVAVLMVYAIPLMGGTVAQATAHPVKFAGFIAGAFSGMLLCNLVMAAATLPFLDRRDALTAGYFSGGRHNALLMAVLPAAADPDIFLFIAAVQFPIYLIPTLLQPLYRRLLPR
jgi:BASS family bile acid:Na+ symporter